MDKKNDKLFRLIKEVDISMSSECGDSSGSEWTPDNEEKCVEQASESDKSENENNSSSILLDTSNIQRQECADDSNHEHEQCYQLNPQTGLLEKLTIIENRDESFETDVLMPRRLINPESGLMEFESDKDTFSGINNSDAELNEASKKGKKKRAQPKTWKKNKDKENQLKKHKMRDIPNCRCRCKERIKPNECKKIFTKFINLSSHTEQNIYLQGCISEDIPRRHRPRKTEPRNRRNFKYEIKLNDRTVTVCANVFLSIHGIQKSRLREKVWQRNRDISDGRGRHGKHPKALFEDATTRIHEFISKLPARVSHYSRTENKHKKYLESNLSIAELHRRFLDHNQNLKGIVKYDKFREIFNYDYNLSFGVPRKDICNTCEKLNIDIKSSGLANDHNKLKELKVQKELHLRRAQIFFENLKKAEKADEHTMTICMDFQKNLPLPVTNVQDEYYRRQLWFQNFGIHNIKKNTATMHTYTENYALKGPNEVITALSDYIKENKQNQETHLQIFCDNCFSQNKNKYLFCFLDKLCARGEFETIRVIYPIPGHSMMPIDRDFALIEKKRITKQNIYHPEEYIKLIETARSQNPFKVVFIEKNLRRKRKEEDRVIKVKNFKVDMDDSVKPVQGISQCREVRFSKLNRPMQRKTMTGPMQPTSLYKTGVSRYNQREVNDAYDKPLLLKQAKVRDIKHLLQFVPIQDRESDVYKDIFDNKEEEGQVESEDEVE